MKRLGRMLRDKTGATTIEHALIAWTIAVVMINVIAASGVTDWRV